MGVRPELARGAIRLSLGWASRKPTSSDSPSRSPRHGADAGVRAEAPCALVDGEDAAAEGVLSSEEALVRPLNHLHGSIGVALAARPPNASDRPVPTLAPTNGCVAHRASRPLLPRSGPDVDIERSGIAIVRR